MSFEAITQKQFAEAAQISSWTVRQLIRTGRVKAIRIGYRTIRIPKNELQRFLTPEDFTAAAK